MVFFKFQVVMIDGFIKFRLLMERYLTVTFVRVLLGPSPHWMIQLAGLQCVMTLELYIVLIAR